jgi:predicted nuclease with TOPRIM domain
MEMLVNYYYAKVYGDDPEAILNALQANDPNIEFLSLYAKINGLKWEFNWNYYDIRDLLNIIKVRNEESHRSPGTLAIEIENREKEFNKLKDKKNQTSTETDKKDELKKKIGSLKSFKKWLDPLPFDEVSAAIKKLSDRVKEQFTY